MGNLAIIGMQFGDEGKGKIVDFFSKNADVVARFNGGDNAGHTIAVGSEKYKLHLTPSGAVWGKELIIATGCVVNPKILLDEISIFEKSGKPLNLFLSGRANVIMPYHIDLDAAQEGKRQDKIGTTKRGIGPCFSDRAERTSAIKIYDLINEKALLRKIKANLNQKKDSINCTDIEKYAESIFAEYIKYGASLKKYICDTASYLNRQIGQNKKILFEGAQGTFLDVDFGTCPFVTSSNTLSGALCCGCGFFPKKIKIYGVVKAYMTRVGEGIFPTELFDEAKNHLLNVGAEYGTTTGRPRRCGWLDLPLLRRAILLNSADSLILTKLDVLAGLEKIKICTHYKIRDEIVDIFPDNLKDLKDAHLIYREFDGFEKVDFKKMKNRNELPLKVKQYIDFIEKEAGISIELISVGPKREETIIC
ncbi:MAG: adenylosuccinate synthase [Candidatus Nanohalarchaeota archaeon]|nr:MAG: adenylosuccinate synthase [Candidatus Nanohaloarchaeota archaeon]